MAIMEVMVRSCSLLSYTIVLSVGEEISGEEPDTRVSVCAQPLQKLATATRHFNLLAPLAGATLASAILLVLTSFNKLQHWKLHKKLAREVFSAYYSYDFAREPLRQPAALGCPRALTCPPSRRFRSLAVAQGALLQALAPYSWR